jgi:hypothetical protein
MQALNEQAVKDIFLDLLKENGKTTTLEVKMELRKKNFLANQEDVSEYLQKISQDESIDFDFNGRYRTYKGSTNNNNLMKVPFTNSVPTPQQNINTTNSKKKKRIPVDPNDKIPLQSGSSGDWLVKDVLGVGGDLYLKGILTDGQAKYTYSKIKGVDYVNVRATRIK